MEYLVTDSSNTAVVKGIGKLPKVCTQTINTSYSGMSYKPETTLAKGWYKHPTIKNCVTMVNNLYTMEVTNGNKNTSDTKLNTK